MALSLPMFVMNNAWGSLNNDDNNDFPYTKNVGRIQAASSEMTTAVMLNSRLVVAPAHASCVYDGAEEQIFIQSCDYEAPVTMDPKTGACAVRLGDTIAELRNRNIPFSRYDVIYAPERLPHLPNMPQISLKDREALMKQMQALFDTQENLDEIFKEDKGIDGFTFAGGDWVILKLKTALPVQNITLEQFKPADLSGMESICLGAAHSTIMTQDKVAVKISPKNLTLRPTYREERGVFYTVVRSLGAQDVEGLIQEAQIPRQVVTPGMSGAPVFFRQNGKWVLGAVVSRNLSDTMLKQLSAFSENESVPTAIRINTRMVVATHLKKEYPVYSIFASLDGLYGKVRELILKSM